MTNPNTSSQTKITIPLILLGLLVLGFCLGMALIFFAAFRWLPLIRTPIETMLAPKPLQTQVAQQEPTQAPIFQPTRAPLTGPTQTPGLVETEPVEILTWPMGYLDDFSWNTYAWYTGAVDNEYWKGQWEVSEGKYRIQLTALQDFATWEYMSAVSLNDFELSADMQMVETSETAEGGLILRGTENNYYAFLISTDRYYWFGLLYNGEWQAITDWTFTDAIVSDRANHLAVTGEGSQFKFFINDAFLGEVENSQFKIGQTGVIVEANQGVSATIEFDNFELRAPLVPTPDAQETRTEPEMPLAEVAGLQGKIIFTSNPDGNYDIYSVNPDGDALTLLTETTLDDYDPAWSPDGKQIVFVSNRDGNPELYRMNADGSDPLRLTNDPADDSQPAWSPDGSQIAFVSWRDGNPELYLMDSNGENLKRLTENAARDFAPTWSPDSAQIAFLSDRDWDLNIFILTLESAQVKQLSYATYIGSEGLSWSPDGQQLAYTRYESGSSELYLRDVQTNSETRLTNNTFNDLQPAWSGDGKYLTFVSAREGSYEIYIMSVAEGSCFRLTDNPARDTFPGWGSH